MCHATLALGLCKTCQNVDLMMTASEFCQKVLGSLGDVCKSIELDTTQTLYIRDQLPTGECRVCKVAKNGPTRFPSGMQRPVRAQPIEPMIEYYVLMRNKSEPSHSGPSGQNYDDDQGTARGGRSSAGRRPAYESDDDSAPRAGRCPAYESDDESAPRARGDDRRPRGRRDPRTGDNSHVRQRGGVSPGPMGGRDPESPSPVRRGNWGDREYRAHSPGPMGRDQGSRSSGRPRGHTNQQQRPVPGGPPPYGPGYGRGYPPGPGYPPPGSGYPPPGSGYPPPGPGYPHGRR